VLYFKERTTISRDSLEILIKKHLIKKSVLNSLSFNSFLIKRIHLLVPHVLSKTLYQKLYFTDLMAVLQTFSNIQKKVLNVNISC